MAATTSTNYTTSIPIKWQKKLLKGAMGRLIGAKWANTDHMGKGEGNTVRINKVLRLAKTTTAATPGTLITASDALNLTSNQLDLVIEHWGASFGFDEDVDVISMITNDANRAVIENQMARTLDYQIMKKLATECMRWRIDKDALNQITGTVESGGSTTGFVDNTGGVGGSSTDDWWNGGFVTVTNADGVNYDITAQITDFVGSSGTIVCSPYNSAAMGQAYTTSSKYIATVGTGIVATDVMTTIALLDVTARHELLETEKFEGGQYRCFLHAAQLRDLWDDTTWITSVQYDQSEHLGNFRIARLFDIEFLISSEMYREDVDGTENQASGVVYVAPVIGKNSYSVISFANPGGSGMFGTKFYVVNQPDSGNLRLSENFLSWKGMFAAGVTRATSVIGLMTGATDPGLLTQ